MQKWLGIDLINSALEHIFQIVPYILFMLAFAALYMFMPNTRVRAVPALVAGLLTGLLWKALGWVFGLFIAGSASYAVIYSAFASVILFMIWIYMGWLIILACSCVCYYLQNPSNQSLARGFRHLSPRDREKLALQIVIEVGADFYDARKGLDTAALCRRLHMPSIIITDIVNELVAVSILAHTEGETPHLIPACPFDTTTVGALLEALETEDSSITGRASLSKNVDKIIKKHVSARRAALGGITLKDLALGNVTA
jgi:membrane protein